MTVSNDSLPRAINNKVWPLNTNYFFQTGNDLNFIYFFPHSSLLDPNFPKTAWKHHSHAPAREQGSAEHRLFPASLFRVF